MNQLFYIYDSKTFKIFSSVFQAAGRGRRVKAYWSISEINFSVKWGLQFSILPLRSDICEKLTFHFEGISWWGQTSRLLHDNGPSWLKKLTVVWPQQKVHSLSETKSPNQQEQRQRASSCLPACWFFKDSVNDVHLTNQQLGKWWKKSHFCRW